MKSECNRVIIQYKYYALERIAELWVHYLNPLSKLQMVPMLPEDFLIALLQSRLEIAKS